MTRKINYACRTCGSEDVTFDATASWDVDAQDYVVSTLLDDCYCNSDTCQGEERRVQEYDADSGEALAIGPHSLDYIPKADSDVAWEAYHLRQKAERDARDRDQRQERIISEIAVTLAAAVEEMPA